MSKLYKKENVQWNKKNNEFTRVTSMKPKILNQVVLINTTNLIDLHNKVVDELIKRYFNLKYKKRHSDDLSTIESIELETLGECVKKETRRQVEPGSLDDRINRFLDENLPF